MARTAPKPPSGLIDTTTTIAPDQLNYYHRNARRGDVNAIMRSLLKHAQYKPLTGNIGTYTGRPNEILAGNHTLRAIRQLAADDPADPRWQSVKVHWGDWDDDTCRTINLADNRTAELGGYDTAELVALLNGVDDTDLSSIGYTVEDVSDLRASLEEQDTPIVDQRPPRLGEDGLIDSNDITENKEGYADAASRLVVLVYPIPQFVWAQEQFGKFRADRGIDTNTEAVLALLADYTGVAPPEAEGFEPAGVAVEG